MNPSTRPVVGLQGRLGEVPPAGTDSRRSWLLALTDTDFDTLTRAHGETAADVFDVCLGWGAVASGLREGDPVPQCVRCSRPAGHPLWFTDGVEVWARCWHCAAVDHLTECEMWV